MPNKDGKLFPGAYTEVHFKMKSQGTTLIIPSKSLIFRSQGLRVPVVRDGKTVLVTVTTGRDFGNTVEVLTGLTAADKVIANPPDSLVEGEPVRVVSAKSVQQTVD